MHCATLQKHTDIWTNAPSLVALLRGGARFWPFKCSGMRPCGYKPCRGQHGKFLPPNTHGSVRGDAKRNTPFPIKLCEWLADRVVNDVVAKR